MARNLSANVLCPMPAEQATKHTRTVYHFTLCKLLSNKVRETGRGEGEGGGGGEREEGGRGEGGGGPEGRGREGES